VSSLASAIYVGSVRHRRREPVGHAFTMPLFMMYLDLAELDRVFEGRVCWSVGRPNAVWFNRADYLGDAAVPLDEAVRARVLEATGHAVRGPIRVLTHLRMFGVLFNPVTFYYCFDERGAEVEAVVAEITNTPWNERHSYVLLSERGERTGELIRWRFPKAFHVSPFMSMEMGYDWSFSTPGAELLVHMNLAREGRGGGVKMFDATLELTRREVTGGNLARVLAAHPFMTARVLARIHIEALRLWMKRAPVHAHPAGGRAQEARR
jgi:DUF1365 family protein